MQETDIRAQEIASDILDSVQEKLGKEYCDSAVGALSFALEHYLDKLIKSKEETCERCEAEEEKEEFEEDV